MAPQQTPILGLIGGIGCGKSAVARWLANHLAVRIVDADAVGHNVLTREAVKKQLCEAFGEDVLKDGVVDRSALAARVFGDTPQHLAARQALEAIVHPVMRIDFEQAFEAAREDRSIELIIFDAAILLESGWKDAVDVIAFIEVPFAVRHQRVASSRGWSEEELRRREASQWPLDKKRAAADVVIDNSGAIEAAGEQLKTWLQERGHLTGDSDRNKQKHQLVSPVNAS